MHIGNMRFLLCAYKIYYYETISFFSKEEQNESHASTDFAYLCSSRYYTVVILIIESNNHYPWSKGDVKNDIKRYLFCKRVVFYVFLFDMQYIFWSTC